jgi:hypothetical protein
MKFQSLVLLLPAVVATPLKTVIDENDCAAVSDLITLLQSESAATSFCSSFAHVSPTTYTVTQTAVSSIAVTAIATSLSTSIVTVTDAVTVTITEGLPASEYTFLPGNPPSQPDVKAREEEEESYEGDEEDDECDAPEPTSTIKTISASSSLPVTLHVTTTTHVSASISASSTHAVTTGLPAWIEPYPSSKISAACSCFETWTQTITIGAVATSTVTNTEVVPTVITVTATAAVEVTVTPSPSVTTVYPCANPFPTLTPTIPYGIASTPNSLGLENNLYYLNTQQGSSAQACCNACFFELANCVQAYWYFYEGCVVSQATDLSSASGQQVSNVCPSGTFDDLTYNNDTAPAFRSTGNIAGPCGQTYNNLAPS